MVGVIVASVVIWLGLAVYNKILAGKNISSFDDDVLKTPKTIDDAVKFFIKKCQGNVCQKLKFSVEYKEEVFFLFGDSYGNKTCSFRK